jgi:hypothetical protein
VRIIDRVPSMIHVSKTLMIHSETGLPEIMYMPAVEKTRAIVANNDVPVNVAIRMLMINPVNNDISSG